MCTYSYVSTTLPTLTNAEDGSVYIWGKGDEGALGLGELRSESVPRIVPFFVATKALPSIGFFTVVSITCGNSHTVALSSTISHRLLTSDDHHISICIRILISFFRYWSRVQLGHFPEGSTWPWYYRNNTRT